MLAMLAAVAVTIPTMWLPFIGFLIPVLTAVVSKYREDSSAVHAIVAITASALTVVVQAVLDSSPDTVSTLALAFASVFIPAVAGYLGFWQPAFDINRKLLPTKGI